ncbi:MAG: Hemolysin III [Pseudoclavibacter caeni]|jgi:hemolysin III
MTDTTDSSRTDPTTAAASARQNAPTGATDTTATSDRTARPGAPRPTAAGTVRADARGTSVVAERVAAHGTEAQLERAVRAEAPGLPHLPITEATRSVRGDRPLMRGWLHAVTFPLALASGIVLIVLAQGAAAKAACAVFMATSILLFGNSAVYHLFPWGPRTKLVLKRIDHSNILLLIAGTYTPLSIETLPPDKARLLLTIVWTGALAGILFRVLWITAPRWLYVAIYLLLGWAAVMYLPDFFAANAAAMILILAGGVLYSIGAVVYATKRPNPSPRVFGFHEVFHAFTVLAFACHCVAIYLVTV